MTISRRMIRLLSSGRRAIDHLATYEEFEYLLSLGEGIDVKNFDNISVRTKEQLFKRTRAHDVKLLFNPETGRVEQHSRSVQIIITNPRHKRIWLEVARTYPVHTISVDLPKTYKIDEINKTVTIEKEQEFTLRETRKIGESAPDAAMACLREELKRIWARLKYTPSAAELKLFGAHFPHLEGSPDLIDRHESSVFKGIKSIVTTQQFEFPMDRFLGENPSAEEETIFVKDYDGKEEDPSNDNWVELHLKSFVS